MEAEFDVEDSCRRWMEVGAVTASDPPSKNPSSSEERLFTSAVCILGDSERIAGGVADSAGVGVAGRVASDVSLDFFALTAGGGGVYPAPIADERVSTAPLENLDSKVALRRVPPWLWVPDPEAE